ncbi:MAG: hypothetical protein Q8N26_34845 [Myxococcales bacterium]|nr:hypothetical protein [Myxococcales bacterium]
MASTFEHEPGFPGEAAVRKLTRLELERQLAEQQTWTRPTDPEKLDAAFAALCARGILCRHDAGPTRTWAHEVVEKEASEAEGQVAGIAYYTTQDLERAQRSGLLYLSAGSLGAQTSSIAALATLGAATHAVLSQVHAALREVGLAASWDGKAGSAVAVTLDWKAPRRPDGEPLLRDHQLANLPKKSDAAPGPPSFLILLMGFDDSDSVSALFEELREVSKTELPPVLQMTRSEPGALTLKTLVGSTELAFEFVAASSELGRILSEAESRGKSVANVVIGVARSRADRAALTQLHARRNGRPVIGLVESKTVGPENVSFSMASPRAGLLEALKRSVRACVQSLKQKSLRA